MAYLKAGKFDQARASLQRALANNPDPVTGQRSNGRWLRSGRHNNRRLMNPVATVPRVRQRIDYFGELPSSSTILYRDALGDIASGVTVRVAMLLVSAPAGINTFVSSYYVRTSLTPSIHRRFAMCLSISDRSKALLSRDSAPIRVKRREVQVRRGSRRRLLGHPTLRPSAGAHGVLGLMPSECSSGPSARRGGITKAGNPACTATTGRSGMGLSGATADRTNALSTRSLAETHLRHRLEGSTSATGRLRRLVARGKAKPKVATAIAPSSGDSSRHRGQVENPSETLWTSAPPIRPCLAAVVKELILMHRPGAARNNAAA